MPQVPPALQSLGGSHAVLEGPARLTSGFGYRADPFTRETHFHEGVDLAQFYEAPVYAPVDGVVSFAGTDGTDGRVVELDAGNGVKMRFGHLNSIAVVVGAEIKGGDKLGSMGSSGLSTGSHLHFEYFYKGQSYDPTTVKGLVLFAPN
jgi:murein DD-endopeptidase MepM/ murein hydrolase activator NlpD